MGIETDGMANNNSSPRKRTKKAGTPNRSTTSSTTGKTQKRPAAGKKKVAPRQVDAAPNTGDTTEAPENKQTHEDVAAAEQDVSMLTTQQQQLALQLLLRGASPAGACQQLGISVFSFIRTCHEEDGFRRHVDQIYHVLSQNVLSALYRVAMEGNVSAQTFWLKNRPPPGWQSECSEPDGPQTFDDFFDQLSDHELLELARTMGVDLPPEIERTLFGAGGGELAGGVPS